jgi:hypothetical protein
VASCKPLGTAASSAPEAKKPSRDRFHLIGLVLDGVSMTVAAWSIAKVYSIDKDYASKQMQAIISESLDNISRNIEAVEGRINDVTIGVNLFLTQ